MRRAKQDLDRNRKPNVLMFSANSGAGREISIHGDLDRRLTLRERRLFEHLTSKREGLLCSIAWPRVSHAVFAACRS